MERGRVRAAAGVALLFAVAILSLAGCCRPVIIRAADRTEVKTPELLEEIRKADFVFIGEVHTKMLHHKAQLELTKGFKALTPEQLAELPPGIECSVDEVCEKFIKEAFGGHEVKGMTFKSFCEAQMVWDNGMAHNAIEYMEKNPGRKMVVLAGGGHSWKRGMPAQIERLSGYKSGVLLPGAK